MFIIKSKNKQLRRYCREFLAKVGQHAKRSIRVGCKTYRATPHPFAARSGLARQAALASNSRRRRVSGEGRCEITRTAPVQFGSDSDAAAQVRPEVVYRRRGGPRVQQ